MKHNDLQTKFNEKTNCDAYFYQIFHFANEKGKLMKAYLKKNYDI